MCIVPARGRASAAAPAVFNEYQVKAAFLFNFAKFVDWPAQKSAEGSPIVLGILGESPFGTHLDGVVKDRRINGREIRVRRFDTLDAARAAHVLFVPKSAGKRASDVAAALAGAGVLTVGEPSTLSEAGGIITFDVDGDRLTFSIDMDEADRAGVRISAQLQKLAKTVRRR